MKSKKAACILQTLSAQECLMNNAAAMLDAFVDVANLEYMSEGGNETPIYNRLLDTSRLVLQSAMHQTADTLAEIHAELLNAVQILEDPNISKPLPLANALHAWEETPLSGSGWEGES